MTRGGGVGGDPAIDARVLDGMWSMLGDGAAEIVAEYLADVPRLVAEAGVAFVSGDAAGLRRAAHTLRSTSELLGAVGVADVCGAVEARVEAGDMAGAGSLLPEVAGRCQAATTALARAAERS